MTRRRPHLLAAALPLVAPGLLAVAVAAPVAGAPPSAVVECDSPADADFDGDGLSDAAVAAPGASVGGQSGAGRVVVLYGGADGLVGEGTRETIQQGVGSVGGIAEAGDGFGASLAVGDLDCDGYSDLVVGTPREDINDRADSGYVQVVHGEPGGLGASRPSTQLTQTNFDREVVAGDTFGASLDVLDDVGQGGTGSPFAFALAIGVPGGDVAGVVDAGWVAARVPVDDASSDVALDRASPGVSDVPGRGDRFGASVALGYLAGSDLTIDLAVGVPRDDVGSAVDAGSVTLLTDVYDAPVGTRLTQGAAGVPDRAERGDLFGASLDALSSAALTRLTVGVPSEDLPGARGAGAAQTFADDLAPGAFLTQDVAKVADRAEPGDAFGTQVAWAPAAPGLPARLTVATPREDLRAGRDAGIVQVFPTTGLAGQRTWTQDSPGVPGSAGAGDRFGTAIGTVGGATETVLVVGVPDDRQFSTGAALVLSQRGGTSRIWRPGLRGVPETGATRFGAALGREGG